MKIYYSNLKTYIFIKRKIKKLFLDALEELSIRFDRFSVNLSIVGEKVIQDLNKKFREKDAITDVLSFPTLELNKGHEINNEMLISNISPFDGLVNLGDIIICKERAEQQAEEFGHAPKREICFLALHSFLHLLGFDHITKEDEKEMFDLTELILNKNGIRR